MSQVTYAMYNNICEFAEKWRGYKSIKKKLTEYEFNKTIQIDHYVVMDYVNNNSKPVFIYLLSADSKYAKKTQEMNKLLSKIKQRSEVIIILPYQLTTYLQRKIAAFKNLEIKCYLHENFSIIVPNCLLSGEHKILSKDEVTRLLNEDLFLTIADLPRIYDDEPQCVWIGAKPGNILQITAISHITYKHVSYRVVVPRSVKISVSNGKKRRKKSIVANDNEDTTDTGDLADVADDVVDEDENIDKKTLDDTEELENEDLAEKETIADDEELYEDGAEEIEE